jgi:hypothetical protein
VQGWSRGGSAVAAPVPRRDMKLSRCSARDRERAVSAVSAPRLFSSQPLRRPIKVTAATLTGCATDRRLPVCTIDAAVSP